MTMTETTWGDPKFKTRKAQPRHNSPHPENKHYTNRMHIITGTEIPKPDNKIPVASHPVSRNFIFSAIQDNLATDPTKHVTNHASRKLPTDNIHLKTTPARTFADVVRSDTGTLRIRTNAQFAPPKPKFRNAVHVVHSFHARTKEKLTQRLLVLSVSSSIRKLSSMPRLHLSKMPVHLPLPFLTYNRKHFWMKSLSAMQRLFQAILRVSRLMLFLIQR